MTREAPLPSMVCRRCRRPLDQWTERLDDGHTVVQLRHGPAPIPGIPPHDPEPILASEVGDEIVGVCDFCSCPAPEWRFPAESFHGPTADPDWDYGSVEDWAACTPCKELIEAQRWRQLANRCLDGPAYADLIGASVRRQIRQRVMGFHQEFQRARKGPPIREVPEMPPL